MQSAQNQPIFNRQFRILKLLGEGSTSKVYLVEVIPELLSEEYRSKLRPNEKFLALKIFKESYLKDNYPRSVKMAEAEVAIMSRLNHKNIIELKGWGTDG